MFCPKCGSPLQPSAQLCPGCGTSLESAFSEAGPAKGKRKLSKKERAAAEALAEKERLRKAEQVREQAEPLKLRRTEPAAEAKMPEEKEKKEEKQEAHEEWKVRFKDGSVFAPVTYDHLLELYKSGQIDKETPVAKNTLTAEWVTFGKSEIFAIAKARREGQQIFCIGCGTPWPEGTKLCTRCGTFIETGEKIAAAGEKKKETTVKFRRKPTEIPAGAPPQAAGVAMTPEVEEALEVPEGAEAGETVGAAVPAEPTAAEALEAVAPAKPRKRGKTVIKLVVALAVVVAAVAVLAPDKMSGILDKVKGLVGLKRRAPDTAQEEAVRWSGVTDNVRSGIEAVQQRLARTLAATPFSTPEVDGFAADVAGFLRGAVEEFSSKDVFVSLMRTLADGKLKEADAILEEDRKGIDAETPTPRFDAIQGCIRVLLRNEKGFGLLTSAIADADIAELATSFSKAAAEGCLGKLLLPPGKDDPWRCVAEILGVKKEDLGDEFLARHCGKVLSGLVTMRGLSGGPAAQPGKGIKAKASVLFERSISPFSLVALTELGEAKAGTARTPSEHRAVTVARILRAMSGLRASRPAEDDRLVNTLREALNADPENALFHYMIAAVYLRTNRTEQATAEMAAGNQKPTCSDYAKERMEGMAGVLDTPLPYTAAAAMVTSPHISALGDCCRKLVDSSVSLFRVGRRKEVFEMLGQWRTACERLRDTAFRFEDAAIVLNAAVPCMAAEAQLHDREGKQAEAWRVRKSLVENQRLAMAINQEAAYGLPAEFFVKEVFSEKGSKEEFSKSSPTEMFAALLSKATQKLDAMVAKDPASAGARGANLEDPLYLQAKKFLDEKKYSNAFDTAWACLTKNPDHVWAFKVMDEAVKAAGVESEVAGPKPVPYMVLGKKDASVPGASRVQYEIEVTREATKEEAIATAKTALQGFLRKEKPDAVRIHLMQKGSRSPYLVLDWAPAGEWEKAKAGTPDSEFKEEVKVLQGSSLPK